AHTGQSHGVLRRDLERQIHVSTVRECFAAIARHVHGSGADATHLHADFPARDQDLRYRPRTFRYRHDPQSRDRPAHSAGGPNHGRRLRDRPREHGGCFTQHPDLLRADADRARPGDVPARTVTLVAAAAAEIADLGRIGDAEQAFRRDHKEYPPSTTSVCAVTMLVSAQRNTIAAAISAGVQARFSSERSIAACLRAGGQGRVQSVSTNPGATALARTSGASARAKFWVRLIRPALLAPYAMLDPAMLRPATDAVLQTAPRVALSAAAAARVQRNGPTRLVARMVAQNSSVSRSSSAGGIGATVAEVPALLARKSSRPSASIAAPTIFSAAPGLDTSPGAPITAKPAARSRATAAGPRA